MLRQIIELHKYTVQPSLSLTQGKDVVCVAQPDQPRYDSVEINAEGNTGICNSVVCSGPRQDLR